MGDPPRLLYDPRRERSACGIGLVADLQGRPSRETLDRALAGLAAVGHRGAWAADGVTGDGAGVLFPLSLALTETPGAGLAMCFLREGWLRSAVEDACRAEGLRPAGWREVPTRSSVLGVTAQASLPRIEQLILAPSEHPNAERRAYRARRRAERVPGVYVASLSFRTVTYKALCAAAQLARFYPDLEDPELAVPFAIFHQRFSTNTEPSWERAQPFRLLCHNGEINTIDGNVTWMEARQRALGDDPALAPASTSTAPTRRCSTTRSSCSSVARARTSQRRCPCSFRPRGRTTLVSIDAVRDFHRHAACSASPGTARRRSASRTVAAAAPLSIATASVRFASPSPGTALVAVSSEAGAVPLPDGLPRATGAFRPWRHPDPRSRPRPAGRRGAPARTLPRRRPYGDWVDAQHRPRRTSASRSSRRRELPGRAPCPARLHARGAEHDAPSACPERPRSHVSSMGDDTAIAPLAGRARPLTTYLRQRFAQVTNPAIDHLRERLVMSVSTFLGERSPSLVAEGPLPRLTVASRRSSSTPFGLETLEPMRPRRDIHRRRRASRRRSTGSSCSPSTPSRRATPSSCLTDAEAR